MDFFASFFLSLSNWLSFVSRVLSIGSRPVERGWELFFLEETLVFFGFFSSPFRTKKYSLPFYSSFVFRFNLLIAFYRSLLLVFWRGLRPLLGLVISLMEGMGDFWWRDSLLFWDLITIDSFELDLKPGDLETDWRGGLDLLEWIYFFDLLSLVFVFLSLLFFDFCSINENLFSLYDYLLPFVLRIIVPLPLERCEPRPSSCSLT